MTLYVLVERGLNKKELVAHMGYSLKWATTYFCTAASEDEMAFEVDRWCSLHHSDYKVIWKI